MNTNRVNTNDNSNIKKLFKNLDHMTTISSRSQYQHITTVNPSAFNVATLDAEGETTQTYEVTSTDIMNGYLVFDLSTEVGETAANLRILIDSENFDTLKSCLYTLTIVWNGETVVNSNTITIATDNFETSFSLVYGGPSTASSLPTAGTVSIGEDVISNVNTIFHIPFYKYVEDDGDSVYTLYL